MGAAWKSFGIVLFVAFLFVALAPGARALESQEFVPDAIRRSGGNAWGAIAEFMGEVWRDTRRVAESFLGTIIRDMGLIWQALAGTIAGLGKFVPASLKNAVAAVWEFLIELAKFAGDILARGFLFVTGK